MEGRRGFELGFVKDDTPGYIISKHNISDIKWMEVPGHGKLSVIKVFNDIPCNHCGRHITTLFKLENGFYGLYCDKIEQYIFLKKK